MRIATSPIRKPLRRPITSLTGIAINESRDLLKATRPLVSRVKDKTRRADLDQAYQQAEVPLVQAVQAGHKFVYDDLRERLSVARQRMEAMLWQLVNPKP